jgi:hypothetical protein
MMHVDDCLRATFEFMQVSPELLNAARPGNRTYNISAMSFNPKIVTQSIQTHYPDFQVNYEVDPIRQAIADSWPRRFDDRNAR